MISDEPIFEIGDLIRDSSLRQEVDAYFRLVLKTYPNIGAAALTAENHQALLIHYLDIPLKTRLDEESFRPDDQKYKGFDLPERLIELKKEEDYNYALIEVLTALKDKAVDLSGRVKINHGRTKEQIKVKQEICLENLVKAFIDLSSHLNGLVIDPFTFYSKTKSENEPPLVLSGKIKEDKAQIEKVVLHQLNYFLNSSPGLEIDEVKMGYSLLAYLTASLLKDAYLTYYKKTVNRPFSVREFKRSFIQVFFPEKKRWVVEAEEHNKEVKFGVGKKEFDALFESGIQEENLEKSIQQHNYICQLRKTREREAAKKQRITPSSPTPEVVVLREGIDFHALPDKEPEVKIPAFPTEINLTGVYEVLRKKLVEELGFPKDRAGTFSGSLENFPRSRQESEGKEEYAKRFYFGQEGVCEGLYDLLTSLTNKDYRERRDSYRQLGAKLKELGKEDASWLKNMLTNRVRFIYKIVKANYPDEGKHITNPEDTAEYSKLRHQETWFESLSQYL